MYVWELVSCRLRRGGWNVWHSARHDAHGPTYIVHLQRPGAALEAAGPTLTEAYAVAARRARETGPGSAVTGPHFARGGASLPA